MKTEISTEVLTPYLGGFRPIVSIILATENFINFK